MEEQIRIKTDILVIGGGIAGWFAADKARAKGLDVTVIDKGFIGKAGQSPYGGGFVVCNPDWGDDIDAWVDQLSHVGEFLNNRYWTRKTLEDSYARYQDLLTWGVKFQEDENGKLLRFPKGAPGDIIKGAGMVGSARENAPFKDLHGSQCRNHLKDIGVHLIDHVMIDELLEQNGRIAGAVGTKIDSFDAYIISAKATILCVGACSYKPAGYPPIVQLTGDGEAMAYRHGGEILGKEFVQPMFTTVYAPSLLGRRGLPEKLNRMAGSDADGWFPLKEVSGVPFPEHPEGGSEYHFSYLDLELETHAAHGPIYRETGMGPLQVVGGASLGMSMRKADGLFPADTECRSNIPGLFAAGDALGTMQDGAVYMLHGGSMCGCAVTGAIAGTKAAEEVLGGDFPDPTEEEIQRAFHFMIAPRERNGGFGPRWVTQTLQNLMMPYYVSFVKKADRLEASITIVKFMEKHLVPNLIARDPHEFRLAHETANMVLSARFRLESALFRTESRGEHYREDYPHRDDENWLAWTKIQKGEDGKMILSKVPLPDEWKPDKNMTYEQRYLYKFPEER